MDSQAVLCRHKDKSKTLSSVLSLVWTCMCYRSCCRVEGDQIIKNSVHHMEQHLSCSSCVCFTPSNQLTCQTLWPVDIHDCNLKTPKTKQQRNMEGYFDTLSCSHLVVSLLNQCLSRSYRNCNHTNLTFKHFSSWQFDPASLFLNCDSGTPGFIRVTLTFLCFYLILCEYSLVVILQSARAAMSWMKVLLG